MALCRSCWKTADHCSYPDEAKPGCLRDKRMREGATATLDPTDVPYAMAKIKLRAIFPDATRIEINPEWLEVEGPPLLPMPNLAQALAVLTTVWGAIPISHQSSTSMAGCCASSGASPGSERASQSRREGRTRSSLIWPLPMKRPWHTAGATHRVVQPYKISNSAPVRISPIRFRPDNPCPQETWGVRCILRITAIQRSWSF
jgi:hypothetical protein